MICNLSFFVYPRSAGQKWRRSVKHLLARWPIFNGRKIVTIAIDECCDGPEDVEKSFNDSSCEFLVRRNVPGLQETAHLIESLSLLQNEPGITLRAHAKGSTHADEKAASHLWLDAMACTCLDYPELIDDVMQKVNVCGPFRSVIPFGTSSFHFAGSWYWLNNSALFSREWKRIDQTFFGVESYPGTQFPLQESICLFCDHAQTQHLYSPCYWRSDITPAFKQWQNRLKKCGLSPICKSPPIVPLPKFSFLRNLSDYA